MTYVRMRQTVFNQVSRGDDNARVEIREKHSSANKTNASGYKQFQLDKPRRRTSRGFVNDFYSTKLPPTNAFRICIPLTSSFVKS